MKMVNKDRNIDIVFCIDGTGSMYKFIEYFKINVGKKFVEDIVETFIEANTNITLLRFKVIVFRDYRYDEDALFISPFYKIPDQMDEFMKMVYTLDAHGGGDLNDNGLEALYYAMKSDWMTCKNDRQIIALFTDSDALDLRERIEEENYPSKMPDLKGLIDLWCGVNTDENFKLKERLKRLIIYAPKGSKYESLPFNRMKFTPVAYGRGLEEIDLTEIIKELTKSSTAI